MNIVIYLLIYLFLSSVIFKLDAAS